MMSTLNRRVDLPWNREIRNIKRIYLFQRLLVMGCRDAVNTSGQMEIAWHDRTGKCSICQYFMAMTPSTLIGQIRLVLALKAHWRTGIPTTLTVSWCLHIIHKLNVGDHRTMSLIPSKWPHLWRVWILLMFESTYSKPRSLFSIICIYTSTSIILIPGTESIWQ